MKLTIEGEPKEIAALILEVSERQDEAAERHVPKSNTDIKTAIKTLPI